MIKDIVVNLSVGAKANSASEYAISVAAAERIDDGDMTHHLGCA
jgi:hypothetical protein